TGVRRRRSAARLLRRRRGRASPQLLARVRGRFRRGWARGRPGAALGRFARSSRMVETRAVSRRRSVCAASVLLLLLAALGCDREDANKDGSPNAVPSTPSPNARILPAPLPTVRGS